MSMTGSISDLAIADLIQVNCLDRKTAKLQIQHQDQMVEVFFKAGEVVHAETGDQKGEEVIYQILGWNEGSFNFDSDVESPVSSITRSWSGLLLEGARRLDEKTQAPIIKQIEQNLKPEGSKMAHFDEILTELAGEVTGYVASALVGIDGITLATNSIGKIDPDAISAQMTMLLKLVDGSSEKLGAGQLEDNLTVSDSLYSLMRFLPGKQYFLIITAERKTGNPGNMRLMSKMYTDRLANAMPR
jgi:predicted regulator of Ras-like GTPase activity (Roadblock/LC7/MglB family)